MYWQYDEGSDIFGSGGPGAFYRPIGSIAGIYLDGYDDDPNNVSTDNSFERWTIIHEWGHHHMFTSFGSNYPNGLCDPNDDDGDGALNDHSVSVMSTIDCAWREGWVDVLPSLVDHSTGNSAVYPVNNVVSYDFEKAQTLRTNLSSIPFQGVDGPTHVGELVEGRVAAAIWDIFDSNVDSSSEPDIVVVFTFENDRYPFII
ncbi:MAG: hypothetical protein J4F36_08420 [Nitrosopumilaceae archaeon]|nr:hypothetical protein [Nitrosopumilaceae archaeon]